MKDSGHMTPDEFRRHGRAVVELVARYMEEAERHPVLSQVAPGDIRRQLPARAPENGEPFDEVLRDVERILMPGVTHWQSPNFFGYFPANVSGPSILGDLLSSGLGVQGMLWATSPACTELETHVMDWLADLAGLPAPWRSTASGGGVIQDSASSSNLVALLAARERASHGRTNRFGVRQQAEGGFAVYVSEHAHSSVEKGARIAGLGSERLRKLPTDDNHAVCPQGLAERVRADRARGIQPLIAVATVGTTSSGAVDPVRRIGEICRAEGLWLHVDGAGTGSFALCPEHRNLVDGLELADSYVFDPHKWLLTNFDCSCFWVANRSALTEALSILPEYLRTDRSESGEVIDYRDWQIPLGRRFRALKLWFVIRHYGASGLRAHLRRCASLSEWFAGQVRGSEDFELAARPAPGLVCFRHRSGDGISEAILNRLNRSGDLHLTHTRLDGRFVLRMAVGAPATRARHVESAWRRIHGVAQELAGMKPG